MGHGQVVVTANAGEWGFFTGQLRASELRPPALSVPDDVRQDLSFVHVAGLKSLVQFFRVTLTPVANMALAEFVVLSVYPPFPAEAIRGATRAILPMCADAQLCAVVKDRTGWAKVLSPSAAPAELVAAAVAYTKITAGWDESDSILVEVNEQVFAISSQLTAGGWQLVVTGTPTPE